MPKNDINTNKSFENPVNKQKKLVNAVNSIDAKKDNLNNNHQTEKEALGPNTHRQFKEAIMAKQGMNRDSEHPSKTEQKNKPHVPEIQGKAKHGKEKVIMPNPPPKD